MVTDLLDLLEEQQTADRLNAPAPSLFASSARGVQERVAEFKAWCEQHDSFASYRRSHAWLPEITNQIGWDYSTELPPRCLPTILHADLSDCAHAGRRCYDIGGLVYRGACYGCTWEADTRATASEAVEDAHDHAWPGWRDLPIVPQPPDRGTSKREIAAMAAWETTTAALLPQGWLAAGGPIVTTRSPGATRDVPGGSRFGGYDLSARPCHERAVAS